MATHHTTTRFTGVIALLMGFLLAQMPVAFANPPGVDTISNFNLKPAAGATGDSQAAAKGSLDGNEAGSASSHAKVARFTARAFAEDAHGINTDSDVVQSAQRSGFTKTCVQEIGSASAPPKAGPKGQQQVVVLRGDLVNVCK